MAMANAIKDINTVLNLVCDDETSDFEFLFSDEEASEELDFENLLTQRNKRVRVQNFLDVVEEYSDDEFRKHFRVNRATANICIGELETTNVLPTHTFGREKVSARKAFLITMWYLANQETYRQLSDRFNTTESAAWRIIRKVVDYLVNKSATFIKWPSAQEAAKIDAEFSQKQGIRGVLGAIDGSHILINRPGANQHAYCNRKGNHSIIIQGVVDHKKRFLDIFCGEPGSLHDSRVLKRSALYNKVTNGNLPFHNRFILGDSAYPTNLDWLVTPYKDNGHLTVQQRTFNYKHSATRVVVENAFALLKGRFRRLRYFDNKDIKFVVKCVIAACTLHNICIHYGEADGDIEPYLDGDEDANEVLAQHEVANLPEGITRREQIFNSLMS